MYIYIYMVHNPNSWSQVLSLETGAAAFFKCTQISIPTPTPAVKSYMATCLCRALFLRSAAAWLPICAGGGFLERDRYRRFGSPRSLSQIRSATDLMSPRSLCGLPHAIAVVSPRSLSGLPQIRCVSHI